MMTDDAQAQEDELLALASIYDEQIFSTSSEGGLPNGQFSACLDLPESFYIKSFKTDKTGQLVECSHLVQHLPPITLYFQLPANYPSTESPSFTLSCQWLSIGQLSVLCKRLEEIWEENRGLEILFLWTSFLKDETINYLNIASPLDLNNVVLHNHKHDPIMGRTNDPLTASLETEVGTTTSQLSSDDRAPDTLSHKMTVDAPGTPDSDNVKDCRAVQDIASQHLLYPTLVEYNKSQLEAVFQMTLFTCHVCFNEKLGRQCIQFSGCDHVYCRACMKGYFEVQIAEGNVQSLTCPDADCDSQAHPLQVKELVDHEAYTRYDRLLLQSSLDTMSDIMYCPRKMCGSAVMIEQEDNLGTCPICRLVFCTFCKMAYHGVSPCKIKAGEIKKLREEYLNASNAERKDLERRYGRRSMQIIVEDSFSQEWLEQYSKMCPSCGTHIQKIDGCNKMTCTKCRCYFCWLCNSVVSKNNPYSHFNTPGSECFNKLFQGVVVTDDLPDDDQDDQVQGFLPIQV